MMGTKTVAQMRVELRRKLSETGEDPIAWLEKRIATGKRRNVRTDVLESIKRVLQRPIPKKRAKSKAKARA
jgi:hypothetical protein